MKDVSFVNLMMRRIYNVLIVANPYDAFMLEDDGRVEEKIYNEYTRLGLRYPPTFTQVSTIEEAEKILSTVSIDLVICMPGNADNDAFDVARAIKARFATIPCVVLTPFSHGITRRMEHEDLSIFDYVFCWLGNTNLILSIIKLIEDRLNIDNDIREGSVQMILLVEDSIRFYSSILPNLYNYILMQSQNFATEALNPHAATLRMRGRPKVMLARNYEEAWTIYNRYKDNCLGVISDVRFPLAPPHLQGGFYTDDKDPEAGLKLLRAIRKEDEYLSLTVESAESHNREKAEAEGFWFVDKNSKKISVDLRHILEEHMGFGDFIFRDPKTKAEVMRIHDLKELQDNIFNIPRDSMLYHISRNHMSRWLSARAIFPVAEFLRNITWHELQDVDLHREIIFNAIVQYRRMKNQGVVALFDRKRFDRYAHFARIGDGSLGGKGRGLAFLDNIIKRHPELNQYVNATVQIPKTVVLCTDVFDEFMEKNDLYPFALSDATDEEILQAFLRAQLPDDFIDDFLAFFAATNAPIAVRSSSLLEDSHYQPFAGVYATYMIPFLEDKKEMLRMLACAIKAVYASVFYRDSKAYMLATSNVIDQEKMAVVLQQVVGKQYDGRFYPNISGVIRSINYYPVGNEKAEEGVVSLALGLGKHIVRVDSRYASRPIIQKTCADERTPYCPEADADRLLCHRHAPHRRRLQGGRWLQHTQTGGEGGREGPCASFHRLHLRPTGQCDPRRTMGGWSQDHLLCWRAPAESLPPAQADAALHATWCRRDEAPCRDRVCLQPQCRSHGRDVPAADTSHRGGKPGGRRKPVADRR